MTQRPSSILVLGVLLLFCSCVCSCVRHDPSHSADDTRQSGATNNAKLAELPVEKEVTAYTPRIDDFRKAYDNDLENQKIQTWEEYWAWVQQFYSGTLVLNGWLGSTKQCVAVVTIPDRRRELAKMMNEVGLVVCREWAKDKTVGKITTNDLAVWGASLQTASELDSGDGTALLRAVELVLRDARQKCSKKEALSRTR